MLQQTPRLTFHLLNDDPGLLQHAGREALRRQAFYHLAVRRPSFKGMEKGVDREQTTAFSDLIEDCCLGGVWRKSTPVGSCGARSELPLKQSQIATAPGVRRQRTRRNT